MSRLSTEEILAKINSGASELDLEMTQKTHRITSFIFHSFLLSPSLSLLHFS